MLGLLRGVSLLSILVTWLALFTSGTVAAPNYISHVYEKLWFWRMYNIVVVVEGANRQQLVLPFNNRKGIVHVPYRNIGSGPDGRLTWNEFMARMLNQPLLAEDMGLSEPGKDGATMEFVAKEMMDKKYVWGAQMNTEVVHPKTMGKSTAMDQLVQALDKKLAQWRLTEKDPKKRGDAAPWRKIQPAMSDLKTLSKWIVIAWSKDTAQEYLPSLLKKEPKSGGLGLGDEKGTILFHERTSGLPDNIMETSQEVDLAGYGVIKIEKLGSDDKSAVVKYEKSAKSHAATMAIWKADKSRVGYDLDKLAKKMTACK